MKNKKIKKYIHDKSLVRIYYFDQEHKGQILKASKNFILFNESNEWHFDGYSIYPIRAIKKIRYSKLEQFQEILMHRKKETKIKNILNWLDLSSWNTIFNSLKNNFNKISIEDASRDDVNFAIGKINDTKKTKIKFDILDVYGKFKKKPTNISIDEITCVLFGDEYSSVLFDYNKNNKPKL